MASVNPVARVAPLRDPSRRTDGAPGSRQLDSSARILAQCAAAMDLQRSLLARRATLLEERRLILLKRRELLSVARRRVDALRSDSAGARLPAHDDGPAPA